MKGGQVLLLLLVEGVEAGARPKRGVILDAAGNLLGEIVAAFEVGRKDAPLVYARPVERPVKRGVEGEIPQPELLIHDGANPLSLGVGELPAFLPAVFVRMADAPSLRRLRGKAH